MKESEFLKPEFLERILKEFPALAEKQISYEIYGSNRKWSRTIYIKFFIQINYKQFVVGKTLRISNHRLQKNVHKQFIVDMDADVVEHRMDIFRRTVQNCINETRKKTLYFVFKKINKDKEDKNGKR